MDQIIRGKRVRVKKNVITVYDHNELANIWIGAVILKEAFALGKKIMDQKNESEGK